MDELIKIILGDFTFTQLFGYVWFFIIGYVIYGLTEVSGRDVNSLNTPRKWSWKFWFLDNWKRYLTTLLCSYVFFRFYNEISGHPFGNIDAIILGICGDSIAASLKKGVMSKFLNKNRVEFMELNSEDNSVQL